MTESRETFETYPYNPDVPGQYPPQDPPPAQLQPRYVRPPAPTPPPPPSGVGRRVVVGAAAAIAIAVVGGTVFSANRQPDPGPTAPAPPFDEEEYEDEPTSAYLTLGDGDDIYLEVPVGWEVVSEGDYLVVSHDSGQVIARVPEWSRASRSDLAKEADYLRDGFEPDGEPTVFDESTSRVTQLHQLTAGHFAGEPATEEVMLVLDTFREEAISLWWATVDAERQVAVEARTMIADLRAGFLER